MEEIVPPVLVFFASMIVTVDLTNIAVQGYVSLDIDLVYQRDKGDLVLVQVILIVDMLMEKNANGEYLGEHVNTRCSNSSVHECPTGYECFINKHCKRRSIFGN